MSRLRASAIAAIAAAFVSLGSSGPRPLAAVSIVRVPDGGIQPQVALGASGNVHLVYFRGDPAHGDLFYVRQPAGRTFTPALRVNSNAGSAIATGNVRGAHIALGRDGRVHVAWMGSAQTHEAKSPAPVLYARMADDRRRFDPERNLRQNPAIGPDGGSVTADRAGNVYVIWHALPAGGKGEADRRVFLARSDDDGRTFAPERVISDPAAGACACCGTAAFVDRRGNVYSLFRAAREAVHRDTFLLRSTDRSATFTSLDLHAWDINACPMSTYSLAQDASGAVIAAAWETGGRVFWTRFDPVTGTPSRIVAAAGYESNQKHPSIAADANGMILLAWTEGMGWSRGGQAAWQIFDAGGAPMNERRTVPGVPAWSLIAAYTTRGGGFTIVY